MPIPDISMLGETKNDCETNRRTFQQLGLPVWFPAIFFTIGAALPVLSWILVGILIFWSQSHKPFEYFLALMLVVTGTFNLDDNIRITALSAIPTLRPFIRLIGASGVLLAVVIYFFPDGHLAHRWLKWVAGIWSALSLMVALSGESPLNYNYWPDPLPAIILIGFALSLVFAVAYRYQHMSSPIQRQQIKWIVAGVIAFALAYITGFLLIYIFPSISERGTLQAVVWLVFLPFYYGVRIFLAGTILFSIMRYRLWDIDFIINRSLVYGTLTILLVVLFGGSLSVIHNLFQNFAQGPLVAVAISAAIFGAIFQPIRRNIQRFVDQRFYNINIDYLKTPPDFTPGSVTQILRDTQFGAYQNLELIGRGGMAEVYKSMHPSLNQPVAIKILPAQLAEEAEFRQRFRREAQVVSQLEHPNIVRVFDSGEQDGKYYMVMEYLLGNDLSELIRASGRLSFSQTLSLVKQITNALDYAHAQGYIHRDIKPSNVLLDMSGNETRAVLTDFGIAKIVNAHTAMTRTGSVLGTFDYIAPEQIQESPNLDGRADIYALGVMVYQMLTGDLPFKHNNPGALLIAHLTQPPPDACNLVHDLPASVCDAVQRAMAKKPEERFATASQFVMALSANA